MRRVGLAEFLPIKYALASKGIACLARTHSRDPDDISKVCDTFDGVVTHWNRGAELLWARRDVLRILGAAEGHDHSMISQMPDLTRTPAQYSGPRALAIPQKRKKRLSRKGRGC